MKLKSLVVAGVLSAAWCITGLSQDRFDLKVRKYFFAGFSGDAESLATGMRLSEEAIAADPKNAQAMVWHGAGLYFQSGQAFQKGEQHKRVCRTSSQLTTFKAGAMAICLKDEKRTEIKVAGPGKILEG